MVCVWHVIRSARGKLPACLNPLLVMTLISRSGVLSPEGNCVKMC